MEMARRLRGRSTWRSSLPLGESVEKKTWGRRRLVCVCVCVCLCVCVREREREGGTHRCDVPVFARRRVRECAAAALRARRCALAPLRARRCARARVLLRARHSRTITGALRHPSSSLSAT